jgi:hypothetical protein
VWTGDRELVNPKLKGRAGVICKKVGDVVDPLKGLNQ